MILAMMALASSRAGRAWARPLHQIITVAAFAALVSLCLEYGFEKPPVPVGVLIGIQVLAVVAYLVGVVFTALQAGSVGSALRGHWPDFLLITVGVLLLVVTFEVTGQPVLKVGTVYVGSIQVLLVLRFVVGAVRWNLEMSQRLLHPSRLVVTSFLIVILVGGCLLSLPNAMSPALRAETGHYVIDRIVGCFFTATSAVCVTGLVVFDTGADFTRFGQVVILVLIQLGGLGIMIFSTLIGSLIGRQLSLRHSLILQDAMSHHTVGQMGAMIRFIVLITLVCELIGALLCYPMFAATLATRGERIFHAVFHAVSAFCNAGFALQADSLVQYRGSWGVYISIMPLIIVGGLGFPVLHDLWGLLKARLRRTPPTPAVEGMAVPVRTRRFGRRYRLNLHTRLVLTTSVILILGPTLCFFTFETIEWRSLQQQLHPDPSVPMADMPVFPRLAASLFQAVTARTAGFNTVAVDLDSMSPASHFLLILLMFIGGSPASTAGGIKTVAFAVLVLGVLNTLRGREHVEAYGRTISVEVIRRASVVVVVMFAVVSVVTLALCVTDAGTLREVLFEAVSACGTVGLSTGLTGRLTIPGQFIIMFAMFAGRLGPLTIMIALAGEKTPAHYEYPEEQVTIG